ncbi:MAG: adenylyl-sulfate kinase [Nitrososphaerales archaeon]
MFDNQGWGLVIWLTGLPASGKTTHAYKLSETLQKKNLSVEVFDGDELRSWLSPEAGYVREDRERHIKRVAHISQILSRNGVITIVSLVSPYASTRAYARQLIGKFFIEVYLQCSLQTCMNRDTKGLYRNALQGKINNMTGIQDTYEEPNNPEITLNTELYSIEQNSKKMLENLRTFINLKEEVVPNLRTV